MRTILLVFSLCGVWGELLSQVLNDECRFSTDIKYVDEYCSEEGEFTNQLASGDPIIINSPAVNQCLGLRGENGVWFNVVPRKPAILIRVFGTGFNGTMRSPKIALFKTCDEFVKCSPGRSLGVDELTVDNLVVGSVYRIYVESEVGGEGSFKLCVTDFFPVPFPESDCGDAVVLCDKSPFTVQSLTGVGKDRNELPQGICVGEEFASAWYKWTCDQPGTLTFTLTPNNFVNLDRESDDLDFALFELPNGINDCSNKILLRCMASGANIGPSGAPLPLVQWRSCNGPTGLRENDQDIEENPGCQPGNDNFLAALNMEAGKSYLLMVNNFSRSGLGFSIEFGGTGTFLGPQVDFEIDAVEAFECDKSIVFTNKSTSATDPIVEYSWNFGSGSSVNFENTAGPHTVIYDSFGDKVAALTVKSSRGCIVSKIIDFYIKPCCADTSNLNVSGLVTDVICHGDDNGQILAQGSAGAPEYRYSLDGQNFRLSPLFVGLKPGDYFLYIQDSKGCANRTMVIVNEPDPLFVDAGPDVTIDLGESTLLNATIRANTDNNIIKWSPEEDFEDPQRLITEVFPVRTTTYTLTLIDEFGCELSDELTVFVNIIRPIYYPNVILAGSGGINGWFNLSSNPRIALGIDALRIYDRWGNLLFEGTNLPINDPYSGWDGRAYKNGTAGSFVEQGVYVWRADVRFIDQEVVVFAGDVTVIRNR